MQGKSLAPLLVVLYASAFLAGFNENIANMGLLAVQRDFGVDALAAQWLVTGYMIVGTIVVTCMAYLYRRLKLRVLFTAAALFGLVGSALCLMAPNFPTLLVARLIQAVGTGIFIPMMINTVVAITPKNRLGSYMSIGSCMITFGPTLAPVACGGIVTTFGWRFVYLVPLIGMAVLLVLGFFFIRNLENEDAHLDIPSVGLSAVALFALSFGLAQLSATPIPAAIALVVAVAAAVVFVVRQQHCADPLVDLSPIKRITFWPTLLLLVVAMMSSFSMSVLLPQYFEDGLGMTAMLAGTIMLLPVLFNALTALVSGRLLDRFGEWPLLPAGFGIVVVGFIVLTLTASSLALIPAIVGSICVYGGVGLVFASSQAAGLRTLPARENAFGVTLATTFVQIAACIGPSLFTGVMSASQIAAANSEATTEVACAVGFSSAMLVATGIAAAGCAIALAYALAAKKRAAGGVPEGSESADASATASLGQTSDSAASLTVGDIMQGNPYTLPLDAPVLQAMRAFCDRKVSGMPVVDAHGRGVGFVSDGDVLRYLADQHPLVTNTYSLIAIANSETFDDRLRELVTLPVGTIMTDKLVAVDVSAPLSEACSILAQRKTKKLPVLRNGRVVGTLNRSDVIRFAMDSLTAQAHGNAVTAD